jgi:peptide-methionine (S)-S-oxide reductase
MTRKLWSVGAILGAAVGTIALVGGVQSYSEATPVPLANASSAPHGPGAGGPDLETIVFSGGCFWGVQAVFQHVEGVEVSTSGYTGGSARTATYPITSTGLTGHAESVRVVFDPSLVSLDQLLDVFFSVAHDPTERNRQGPDVGPQYRSAVWTASDAQGREVRAYIDALGKSGTFSRPIVTEIGPLEDFYLAETYHQDYLINHPNQPYIRYYDLPKLEQLKKDFPGLWRDETAPWRPRSAATAD